MVVRERKTPREVLFRVMKSELGISNKELAALIFSDKAVGGLSPRERAMDPTRRRREFLEAKPNELDASWELVPAGGYADELLARCKKRGNAETVVALLGGDAARDLRESLDAYELDGALYSNMVVRVEGSSLPLRERALALLILFVETAVRGRPGEAIRLVMARERLLGGSELGTLGIQAALASPAPAARLALMRCEGSMLYPTRTYPLKEDEAGTVVGAMALEPGDVSDVGANVSRRHVHVWLGEDGLWRVKDLGSTYGSELVSGDSGKRFELGYEAVVLGQSDRLILAGTTEFLVVAIPRV